MKKQNIIYALIAGILCLLLILTGCKEGSNDSYDVNEDTVTWRQERTNLSVQTLKPMNLCEVYLTFGNEIITVQLYDNATSRDLVSRLPLSLTFSDYNNTEKIAYLPSDSSTLDTSDAPDTYTPASGDLTVYAPWGNIAIFYKAFRSSAGLVPLGKIERDGIDQLSQIRDGTTVTIRSEKT